jgi:hypothetical protein
LFFGEVEAVLPISVIVALEYSVSTKVMFTFELVIDEELKTLKAIEPFSVVTG